MRGLFLTIVFFLSLAGALVAFVPLGFLVNQTNIASSGIGWTQIQGTMLNGRISGMHYNGQDIGDVKLKLKPLSLLGFAPEYEVQWGGAGGQGTGTVKLSGETLTARDVRLQQKISAIQGLSPPVAAAGGTLRLSDGEIHLTHTGCKSASGAISTDTLSKVAQQYGREFGAVSGPLSCKDGNIHIDMEGRSQRGDAIIITAHTSLIGAARFDAYLETSDAEIIFALPQIGFIPEDDRWHYYYEQPGGFIQ